MPRGYSPQRSRAARRGAGRRNGDFALAVRQVERADGQREELRVTGSEVVHVVGDGDLRETRRIALDQLGDVRKRQKVRDLETIVAMSYLLGAVTFLNILVNDAGSLSTWTGLTIFYLVVGSCAVATAAAWLGRVTVLRFESKDHATRFDMSIPDDHDDMGGMFRRERS